MHRHPGRATSIRLPIALALLCSATLGQAMDQSLPADARVTVLSESGEPIAGARVRIVATRPEWPLRPPSPAVTTDADGTAQLSEPQPDGTATFTWAGSFQVQAEGYFPGTASVHFFPGAHFEQTIRLEPIRTTRIRLQGPNHAPLKQIPLFLSYIKHGVHYTDHGNSKLLMSNDHGECLWNHPPLPEGFQIVGRPEKEFLPDQPVVTVHYKADEVPKAVPLLRGRLHRADATPAEGWYVARRARVVYDSGGMLGWSVSHSVQVENLTPVGPEGTFEVDAEESLVLVSPEGVPMLYRLAPDTWEGEVREITLRVPEIREIFSGEVHYADGRPVVGLPLQRQAVLCAGERWEFIRGWNSRTRIPLAGSRASNGSIFQEFQTDSDGHYSVPIYYGTRFEFKDYYAGWHMSSTEIAGIRQSILKRAELYEQKQLKDLVLAFQDEQGDPVSNLQCSSVIGYQNGKSVRAFCEVADDVQGRHVFVEEKVDHLELSYQFRLTAAPELKQLVDVSGPADRTVHVTVPQEQRPLPLSGIVLDPAGRPLKHVRILPYDPALEKYGNRYYSVDHVTDEQGRFHFEIAPDNCFLAVLPSRKKREQGLPGWLPVTRVDRTTRQVAVRLSRGGRLRVLLPLQAGPWSEGLFLIRKEQLPKTPDDYQYTYFVPCETANQLRTRIIPPGHYRLSDYRKEDQNALATLGSIETEIRVDEVATIDLREAKLSPPEDPSSSPERWSIVTVKQNEQIVSGAEVTVLSRIVSEKTLSRWLAEATDTESSSEARSAAMKKLRETGAQAVDAIRADQHIIDPKKFVHELGYLEADGWNLKLRDLSDNQGQVRCRMEPGFVGVAIARVRGRLIGRQEFSTDNQSVTVQLRPARTLAVDWSSTKEDHEGNGDAVWLRMNHSSDPGIRGLMSVLFDRPSLEVDSSGWLQPEGFLDDLYTLPEPRLHRWIVEDLPIGSDCTLVLTSDSPERSHPLRESKHVTIEPGEGMQQMHPRTPIRKLQPHPTRQRR